MTETNEIEIVLVKQGFILALFALPLFALTALFAGLFFLLLIVILDEAFGDLY